jgi:hypothetical protein
LKSGPAVTSEELELLVSEVLDSEALDSEALDSEALDSEALDSEVLDSEVLDSEVLDSEVLDSEVLASEVLDSEVLDSEVLDFEALLKPGDELIAELLLVAAELGTINTVEEVALDNAELETTTFDEIELEDAVLEGATLDGSKLDAAALEGATLDGSKLDAAALEGATLDGSKLDTAALEGATLDGSKLEAAELEGVGTIASLDFAEDPPIAELTGTWIMELWLELEPSSVGTPASIKLSRKWLSACSTDTMVVVVEPELAIKLVTAVELANWARSRLKSTWVAARAAAGLMLIPLAGSPSTSRLCNRRAIFSTTGEAGFRLCAISNGVTRLLAGIGGNSSAPIEKVTVSPGK